MGLMAALGSYVLWGLLPIYWKALGEVSAYEILAHRIIWSFVFMVLLLWGMKKLQTFRQECAVLWQDKRRVALLLAAAVLITMNWGIYIWAVMNKHVVDTSVGYYMNPLVSVFLGVLVFQERLSGMKWAAIALACCGILGMTWELGRLPFVAVGVASTFAMYGAVKKKLQFNPLYSITLETLIILPFFLAYVLYLQQGGEGHLGTADWTVTTLLVVAGAVTAIPLVLFSIGANNLPLNVLGFCQYVSPSITLILGLSLFGESFSRAQLIAFSFIWTALVIFTIADWRERKFLERQEKTQNG